jgi:hypothetical protein
VAIKQKFLGQTLYTLTALPMLQNQINLMEMVVMILLYAGKEVLFIMNSMADLAMIK